VAVEDHRRVRLVGAQEPVERLMDRGHLGLLEGSLDVLERVASGERELQLAQAAPLPPRAGQLADRRGVRLARIDAVSTATDRT